MVRGPIPRPKPCDARTALSSKASPQKVATPPRGRLGVWVFGAYGGLATTLVVGARAIARGKAETHGLLTETPMFDGVPLAPIDKIVFGGHEIRDGDFISSAEEIHRDTGTIPYPLLSALKGDLAKASREVRPGCLVGAGRTIEKLATGVSGRKKATAQPLRTQVKRLQRDIRDFMKRHKLKRCVCVNLVSTEPKLRLGPAHRDIERFEQALDDNRTTAVRPSAIYAYTAASLGLPFVHFTPANSALIPAITQMFDAQGAPYMGADGKTGETLVKSALAPMFKYRNLQVLSWQGYNMLGDRDGVVLDSAENKASKVDSKDSLLQNILGYPLHTHVGIDYVPSLGDLKTAWDFIHFRGFLGFKMSMQFVWQGCDAILAAPLVLDMVRMADCAKERGETGPLRQLSCFFKRPMGVDEQDLHQQWHLLTAWVKAVQKT